MRLRLACLALVLPACASEGLIGSLAGGGAAPEAPPVSDPLPVVRATSAIGAGGASTCVKTKTNELVCWGENGTGSLGIGDVEPATSRTPVSPSGLRKVRAIASGERAHCALRDGGGVSCWGDMYVGEIAGQKVGHLPITTPFGIEGVIGDIAQVAVGRFFTCALLADGEVRCFGANERGQLGIDSGDDQPLPTTVKGFDAPVTSIAASMGGVFACATTQLGSVYCWGDNGAGQIGAAPAIARAPFKIEELTEPAVEVVAGAAHACVRYVSGNIACWGAGTKGQLGDGNKTSSAAPVPIPTLTDVARLAAGGAHTCAMRTEGSIFCWGDDASDQAGATPDPSRPWVVVNADFAARHVSCGLSHTCAWGEGGRVRCWGSDASAQLGPKSGTF
ncbi:MAG: hypothetical protein KF819_35245 [Labilithrix sp.]|nr:hypothetical protein [Labilithrix sp.]